MFPGMWVFRGAHLRIEGVGEARATEALRAAGWSEGRSVDITADREALAENCLEVWPELETFLRQYSSLSIKYLHNGHPDEAWFGSARACREAADPTWATEYGTALHIPFAPIGCCDGEYVTLYATADGRYFGGFDSELSYLGCSPTELIHSLVNNICEPVDWRPPLPPKHENTPNSSDS